MLRRKIFEIIEVADSNNVASHIYDVFMMISITLGLLPLAFRNPPTVLVVCERITVVVFVIDYLLRIATADLKLKKGFWSFILYPFTFMAIIDLLSILPSVMMINKSFRALRGFRLIRALRVLKIFKSFRYSRNIIMIGRVFSSQRRSLITVFAMALGYIFFSALIIFNVEPETFGNFFNAIYWATISLTTVGYGDIYTTSILGKAITMLSALLGVAVVALPAGIVTAGYMKEIEKETEQKEEKEEKEE